MAKFNIKSLTGVKKFDSLQRKAKEYGFALDVSGNDYILKTKPRTIARELFGHERGGYLVSSTDLSCIEGLIEGFGLIASGLTCYANIDYKHVREQMEMKATMDALMTPPESEDEYD